MQTHVIAENGSLDRSSTPYRKAISLLGLSDLYAIQRAMSTVALLSAWEGLVMRVQTCRR
jgi:hypothetical protein